MLKKLLKAGGKLEKATVAQNQLSLDFSFDNKTVLSLIEFIKFLDCSQLKII